MKKLMSIASLAALAAAPPLSAQDTAKPKMLSPGQIVDQAAPEEWQAIAASDLLIMKLQPDAKGKERQIIIQLMPPPFSQGWVRNIRKLAKANWWDGTRIVRVQDNYVVQWGDPAQEESQRKPLPDGLEVMTEEDYVSQSPIDFDKVKVQDGGPAWQYILMRMYVNGLIASGVNIGTLDAIADTQGLDGDSEPELKDRYANGSYHVGGWQIAERDEKFYPVHCYSSVGVGRGLSPDTGSGAELYTVIGHAPRHLDRNIAVVGRIIEGMHHLSSLPRGFGPLGFYETPEEQVPIQSIRLASELPAAEQPRFEYLSTEGESFAKYANRRANREPPFFIKPAGGADICNIPVPVRRVKEAD
jgi:cyclophilin family peptidyl-prolyl cis-trans isomerase